MPVKITKGYKVTLIVNSLHDVLMPYSAQLIKIDIANHSQLLYQNKKLTSEAKYGSSLALAGRPKLRNSAQKADCLLHKHHRSLQLC